MGGVLSDNVQPLRESERGLGPLPPPSSDESVFPFESVWGRYANLVKPAMDQIGAALLLILTSPIILIIAVAVVVDVGRPIIFRQVRVGRNGSVFTVYKFCTMTNDRRCQDIAIDGDDRRVSHKRDDDPRLLTIVFQELSVGDEVEVGSASK